MEVQHTDICIVLAGCHQEKPLKNRAHKKKFKSNKKVSYTFKYKKIRTAWLQQVSSNDINEMIYAISGKGNINLGWLEVSCTALCIVQCQLLLPSPPHTHRDRSRSTPQLHTLHFTDIVNPTEDSHTDMDSVRGLRVEVDGHADTQLHFWHPPMLRLHILLLFISGYKG